MHDLPRRADLKVARHWLDRRIGPSSPEGLLERHPSKSPVRPTAAPYARPATSPVCVFTRTVSPSFMNRGTLTSRPVWSFATFVAPPAAVSPLRPGSQ